MRAWWSLFVSVLLVAPLVLASCQSAGNQEVRSERQAFVSPGNGKYMDFEDVRIPEGMKVNREGSFVYETRNVKAGMLNLDGRTKIEDALEFFEERMPQDGWTMLSSFTYQKNVQLFTKPGKVCMVLAHPPGTFRNLNMEVWVSPIRAAGEPTPNVVVPESGPYTGPNTYDNPNPDYGPNNMNVPNNMSGPNNLSGPNNKLGPSNMDGPNQMGPGPYSGYNSVTSLGKGSTLMGMLARPLRNEPEVALNK